MKRLGRSSYAIYTLIQLLATCISVTHTSYLSYCDKHVINDKKRSVKAAFSLLILNLLKIQLIT